MLNKIAYLYWSKLLKIDENDKNAEVNIFQGIIDTIVIVFVGCYKQKKRMNKLVKLGIYDISS